jgi:hypothetical protein
MWTEEVKRNGLDDVNRRNRKKWLGMASLQHCLHA